MPRITVPPTTLSRDTRHALDFLNSPRLPTQWYYDYWFGYVTSRPLIDKNGYILRGYWGVEAAVALGVALVEVVIHG